MAALKANKARGEVACEIAGKSVILFASLEGLGRLEAELGTETMPELLRLVSGAGPKAIRAVVECLTIKGDAEKALADAGVADIAAIHEAALMALAGPQDADEGNADAAEASA